MGVERPVLGVCQAKPCGASCKGGFLGLVRLGEETVSSLKCFLLGREKFEGSRFSYSTLIFYYLFFYSYSTTGSSVKNINLFLFKSYMLI